MLELEPPRHTRLRSLVLRAFTSRRIAALAPEIAALCARPDRRLPAGRLRPAAPFRPAPARHHHRPPARRARGRCRTTCCAGPTRWSACIMAGRTRATEDRAVAATEAFVAFLRGYVEDRRARPADDLITHLIAAEAGGREADHRRADHHLHPASERRPRGDRAHHRQRGEDAAGNRDARSPPLPPTGSRRTVEEILRFDPPLHMFTRHAYEDVEVMGHTLPAAATRSACCWPPRTATRRLGPARTVRPGRARSSRTPPSARACISASARRLPGWNCRSPCRSCSQRLPEAAPGRAAALRRCLPFPRAGTPDGHAPT